MQIPLLCLLFCVCCCHYWVTLSHYPTQPGSTGEQKTKPTQNSVRQLRGQGLSPDLVGNKCFICMYTHICMYMSTHMHMYVHVCKYVCIHTLAWVHTHVLMYTLMYVRTYMITHTCIHEYTYVHTYVRTCVHCICCTVYHSLPSYTTLLDKSNTQPSLFLINTIYDMFNG